MQNERTVVIERVPSPHALPAHLLQEERPGFKAAALVARLVLGTVMLVAGVDKLAAPEVFGANIYNYQILPVELVNIAALLFIWAEIAVGILLIVGAAIRGSAFVSGLMLVLFVIAIGSAMARGLKIDCGCFAGKTPVQSAQIATPGAPSTVDMSTGSSSAGAMPTAADAEPAVEKEEPTQVGWPKIFEDLGLLALAVFLVYYPRSHLSIDSSLRREDIAIAP